MKTKTLREKIQILQSQGFNKPETVLGYIWIERYFRLDEDGYPRCSKKLPHDKLLSANYNGEETRLNIHFTSAALEEFFPGFTGYSCLEEIEMDDTPWRKP
jgi:hypothetical protein